MDNLESNISISDSTADGLRSDPYLRDAIALPKFEPESLDEYNARRLAQCKEKLRALLFGMFTQTGKDIKFFDQDIEEVLFMGWAEQVVCLPPSRLLDALSEQQNVLRELDYGLPTAGGGTADNGRFLTFTERQYGSVMCIFMRELLIRTIVRYTTQRSYVTTFTTNSGVVPQSRVWLFSQRGNAIRFSRYALRAFHKYRHGDHGMVE